MREAGFQSSNDERFEDQRNVDPLTYTEAINVITRAGGWVFRMGDPTMTPLPNIPQVIDYAHCSMKSDWMDVFLGATCKFCLATSSGYYVIPRVFGVPVLLTNSSSFPYFSMREIDLFLPFFLEDRL